MSKIEISGCTIYEGVLKEGHVGDNIYQNMPTYFKYFNAVVDESNNEMERKLAERAKKLYQTENHAALKKLLTNNITAFTSGTFATVAGGLLLQAITDFIK